MAKIGSRHPVLFALFAIVIVATGLGIDWVTRAAALAVSIPIALYLTFVVLRRVLLTAGSFFLPSRKDPPELQNFPKITIFIPAHNEATVLAACLKSVSRIDYPSKKLEVVVIDDASTDGTSEVAESFREKLDNFHLLKRPPGIGGIGKPAALNDALARYRNQNLCYFLDADTTASSEVLKRAAAHLASYKVGAVTGTLEPRNPYDSMASFYTAVESWTHQLTTLSPASKMGFTCAVLGSNWAIRRKLLDAYGLKSDALLEDTELSVAMNSDGFSILFDKKMTARIEVPPNVKEYFRQHIGWARGFSHIARKRASGFAHDAGNIFQKIDRAIYSAGYLDRPLILLFFLMILVNCWYPVFFAPWKLGSAALIVPGLQLIGGMVKARRPVSDFLRLPCMIPMFMVDIAAAVTAIGLDAFSIRTKWYKTGRRKDSGSGKFMDNSGDTDG